jgi:hypothetical protein
MSIFSHVVQPERVQFNMALVHATPPTPPPKKKEPVLVHSTSHLQEMMPVDVG